MTSADTKLAVQTFAPPDVTPAQAGIQRLRSPGRHPGLDPGSMPFSSLPDVTPAQAGIQRLHSPGRHPGQADARLPLCLHRSHTSAPEHHMHLPEVTGL